MRRTFLWTLLVLVVLAGLTVSTAAQTKSLYWNRFDVDVSVQLNGDLQVVETQEITFQGGSFHYGYATIPGKYLTDITNVQVSEGNQVYQQSASGQEYTFQSGWENGDLWVRWYFPYTSNSSHTFTFSYTVEGAVRRYADGDEVRWMAVPGDHDYLIRKSQVTVHLPEGVTLNKGTGDSGYVVATVC